MSTLFDVDPNPAPTRREPSEPAWVAAFTRAHGATPTLNSGRARPVRCTCSAWTLQGLDAPRCAGLAVCDPNPLTPQLEAAAVILAIPTYRLWGSAGRYELTPRHQPRVPPQHHHDPAGPGVVVLAAHTCGRAPLAATHLQLTAPAASGPTGEPPF